MSSLPINSWVEWCEQSCCNKFSTAILFWILATLSPLGMASIRLQSVFFASLMFLISFFNSSKLDRCSWNSLCYEKESLMSSCRLFMKWKSYLWQTLIIITNSHHASFHLLAHYKNDISTLFSRMDRMYSNSDALRHLLLWRELQEMRFDDERGVDFKFS